MSEASRQENEKIFEGPFSKVVLEFEYEDGPHRDRLRIIFYDENGRMNERVSVGTRVSSLGGAVLMIAASSKGETF